MRKFFKSLFLSSVLATASIFQASAQVAVPFTMTESIFNSSDVDKGTKYRHVWEKEKIRMYSTGLLSDGCGFCWDDHYFTVHIADAPDRVSFTTSASGASTGNGWTLEESADGSEWTTVWSKRDKSNTVDVELSKSTRYIRLHENFNYSGYVSGFTVTACHYVKYVAYGKEIFVSEPLRASESVVIEEPTAPIIGCGAFLGWDKSLPEVMPNEDVVITALYDNAKYTATIQFSDPANGLALTDGEQVFECGEPVVVEAPVVEGFTLTGWTPALPATGVAEMEGETYVAQWTRNIHTASFVAGTDTIKESVAYADVIPAVTEPVKKGYEFVGWLPEVPDAMPDEDLTFVAQFKQTVFALNVVVDGKNIASDSILAGEAIDRENYRPADTTGFDFEWTSEDVTTMPEADLTFLGSFVRKNYGLKIYDADSIYVDSMVAYAANVVLSQPVKRGYGLNNWSDVPAIMPAEAVDVELTWEKLYYPLVMMMGEDTFFVASYAYGDTIVYPATPDSVGYFWVWDTELPVVMSDADMAVNGSWKPEKVYFTAISEGDTVAYSVYKPGDMIDPVVLADRVGFTFDGWLPEVPVVMTDSNFTTVAQWSRTKYPLIALSEGDTLFSVMVPFEDSISLPAIETKKGHTLLIDPAVPAIMPADTVVLTVSWVANTYPFTLKDGDSIMVDSVIAYGTELSFADLDKEGHTFVGWNPAIPATMPDSAFAADAEWSVNSYSLIVKTAEDTLYNEMIPFQSEIKLPPFVGEEGYTLVFKNPLPATMPADSVVINASWEKDLFPFVLKDGEVVVVDSMIVPGDSLQFDDLAKTGYTFNGWNPEIPAVMPDTAFMAEAMWQVNSYDFIVMVGEDTLLSQKVEYQAAIEPAYEEKKGHTLVFDVELPKVMPAEDVVVSASWVANTYPFTLKDGEDVVADSAIVYGADLKFDDLTKTGYTFSGWNPEIPATMPDSAFVAEAMWQVNSYDFIVMVEDDTLLSQKIEYQAAVEPAYDEKKGHTLVFDVELPKVMPAEDVVVSASWVANKYQFTLKDGEDVVADSVIAYGAELKFDDLTKTGYTFEGWNPEIPATMPDSDFVAQAVWDEAQFLLITVVDGDSTKQAYAYGADVTVPTVAEKVGYTFSWLDAFPKVMPAEDVVVKGAYSVNSYHFVAIVDGDTIKNQTYNYGEAVETVADPAKTGYTFKGWGATWPETMPAEDVTLSAVWSTSTFSYKVMDGEIALIDTVYEYGATIADLTAPTKEGHKFVKWDTLCKVMPAYDVVVNAEWNVLSYTVTLMMVSSVNNAMLGTPARLTFAYGENIVIADPVFAGYEFANWKNECPATMPAKGFALIAVMKPIPQQVGCQDVQEEALSFSVSDKTIYLMNKGSVKLYDLLGNVVYEGSENVIPVGRQGVYVLCVGKRSYKVIVR